MPEELIDENVKVTLEPVIRGAALKESVVAAPVLPSELAFNVVFKNAGDSPVALDLYRGRIAPLVLQVQDADGRPVFLPPPSVPRDDDVATKQINVSSGDSYNITLAGFLDLGQKAGTYRIRYHHAEAAGSEGRRRTLVSDWVEVSLATAELPVAEPITPAPEPGWLYNLFCLIFYRLLGFLFKKRCRRVASTEVSKGVTETISNAPPGDEAWNGTYSWNSRFKLTLDQRKCRVRVTVRVHINGAITAAQRDAWEAAVEAKWSNKFKLCCKEKCCKSCCPNGYTIICDLQFVPANGEHYVVTAGAATTNMTNWGTTDTIDITHEFGHMLGNKEEYFTVDGVDFGAARQPGGNVMNNPANDPVPAHFNLVKEETEKLIGGGTRCVVKSIGEAC